MSDRMMLNGDSSSFGNGIQWLDTDGNVKAFKNADDKPRISCTPYTYDIAKGVISGHSNWTKIGFNGALVASTEADIWSATGNYAFPPSAMQMEVVSTDNTQDLATVIKGDATGNTYQSTGGSTTTLIDTSHGATYFTDATSVAAGDIVILDPHGTTPEWGYVTSVSAQTITCSGGFSSGGTGASRYYAVIDYSANTGAKVVKVEYLDGSFISKSEICLLNGTTPIDTVNTDMYRINSFRVIGAGSNNKPVGNLAIRETDGAPNYSYITAGFTRARNVQYTVPSGKTLYIHTIHWAYGYSTNQTHYCRIYTRANLEPSTNFRTGSIFYPFSESIEANTSGTINLINPTRLPYGIDLKVSAVATYAGSVMVSLKGWIE